MIWLSMTVVLQESSFMASMIETGRPFLSSILISSSPMPVPVAADDAHQLGVVGTGYVNPLFRCDFILPVPNLGTKFLTG
jgi:hypothetical protein